jgi:hypothetical protein
MKTWMVWFGCKVEIQAKDKVTAFKLIEKKLGKEFSNFAFNPEEGNEVTR